MRKIGSRRMRPKRAAAASAVVAARMSYIETGSAGQEGVE
jgi:hypothetical protein